MSKIEMIIMILSNAAPKFLRIHLVFAKKKSIENLSRSSMWIWNSLLVGILCMTRLAHSINCSIVCCHFVRILEIVKMWMACETFAVCQKSSKPSSSLYINILYVINQQKVQMNFRSTLLLVGNFLRNLIQFCCCSVLERVIFLILILFINFFFIFEECS